MRFEVDFNTLGNYIWRLKASNGKIVADSGESYVDKRACLHGITLVQATTSTTQFSFFQDSVKQWRWHLPATNGKVIADSAEGYWNRADAETGAQLVVATSPVTPVRDLTA